MVGPWARELRSRVARGSRAGLRGSQQGGPRGSQRTFRCGRTTSSPARASTRGSTTVLSLPSYQPAVLASGTRLLFVCVKANGGAGQTRECTRHEHAMHTPCTRQRVGGGQRQTPFCDSGPVRSQPPSQPPSQPAASSGACSQTYRAWKRELMRHVISAWYVWRVVCGAWCVAGDGRGGPGAILSQLFSLVLDGFYRLRESAGGGI